MEGGVFEDERMIGNKRGRELDEKEGEKMGGRLGKRPSGIVVMDEYSYSGDEMINGVKYEEEKTPTPTSSASPIATTGGGGFFNQLIANLVNNNTSDHEAVEVGGGDQEAVVKKDDGVVEEINGGVIVDNKENADNGGERLVDDIVSKLPRTLSEDTVVRAPEADEASILLHSIIHD